MIGLLAPPTDKPLTIPKNNASIVHVGPMRTRQKRNAVRLSAQMRSDLGRTDIQIHDISERGMLLSRADAVPPAPGSYLEVRRGAVAIVARIVWRSGRKFGVTSQDLIDPKGLIATSPLPTLAAETVDDRKARHRAAASDTAERSRSRGRLFQYAFLLTAVGAGTVALAGSVTKALAPLRSITASLIGE